MRHSQRASVGVVGREKGEGGRKKGKRVRLELAAAPGTGSHFPHPGRAGGREG